MKQAINSSSMLEAEISFLQVAGASAIMFFVCYWGALFCDELSIGYQKGFEMNSDMAYKSFLRSWGKISISLLLKNKVYTSR